MSIRYVDNRNGKQQQKQQAPVTPAPAKVEPPIGDKYLLMGISHGTSIVYAVQRIGEALKSADSRGYRLNCRVPVGPGESVFVFDRK